MGGGGFKPVSWIVSCVTGSHHASEGLLYVRVLAALQHRLEQQWILGDPLMRFGLHVAQPHPLTLRVSLHPLDMQTMVIWTAGFTHKQAETPASPRQPSASLYPRLVVQMVRTKCKLLRSKFAVGFHNYVERKLSDVRQTDKNKPIFKNKSRWDVFGMFLWKRRPLFTRLCTIST